MKKVYWFIIAVALVLLAIGTFLDVQINQLLYTPGSAFGQALAVAAMVPIWVLIPMATGLMLGFLITRFADLCLPWRVACVLLLLFGVYAAIERMYEMVGSRHLHGLPYYALVWLTVLSFMAMAALGAVAARKYPRAVFLAAVVGIAAIAGSRFVLDHSKNLWGRQRFWTMDDPAAQFTAWYQPQFPDAARRAEMGDLIKSFPSGHSMGSISTLWLSMLPPLIPACRRHLGRWVNGLSIAALAFWACTMLARMLLGEHFLSDVAISGIIFLLFFIAATALAEKFRPAFPDTPNE